MSRGSTVLVADSDDERRRNLGLALCEGGYEVVNAVNGEEALRFTAGLDPELVVVHSGLAGLEPEELYSRLAATGLSLPPFLVLGEENSVLTEDNPDGEFHYLPSAEVDPERFLFQVRLLLLARDIGGEVSDELDVLYGELARTDIGDLLRVLERNQLSGHVGMDVGPDVGIWVKDGEVIDAHWGGLNGRKAFNRVAGLHRGGFVVRIQDPMVERVIAEDLPTLVSDAVEERIRLDEAFRRLPPLSSRLELKLGAEFFNLDFSPAEREVLSVIQQVADLADLLDLVKLPDIEVLEVVESLRDRGVVDLHEAENLLHVVTDSTCDLLPSFARSQDITVVPLSVVFGKAVYRDGVDLQPEVFYSMMGEGVFPSTSPPGKGEFLESYRRLVASGDILSIHISRRQSLTAQNAEEAAEEGAEEFERLREEAGGLGTPVVRIVDSKSTSVGLGMLVVFANRMARRGLGADEIATRIEDIRERLHFLFIVDTLEYLRKGGRIGGARALIGNILGIKPILGMVDGEVVPVDKVRGGRRAQPRLVEILRREAVDGRPSFVALAHASAPKWAARLKDLLNEEFQVVEMFEGEIGPVVGAHTGPGTVGAILFQPTDEELELLQPE